MIINTGIIQQPKTGGGRKGGIKDDFKIVSARVGKTKANESFLEITTDLYKKEGFDGLKCTVFAPKGFPGMTEKEITDREINTVKRIMDLIHLYYPIGSKNFEDTSDDSWNNLVEWAVKLLNEADKTSTSLRSIFVYDKQNFLKWPAIGFRTVIEKQTTDPTNLKILKGDRLDPIETDAEAPTKSAEETFRPTKPEPSFPF